MIHSMASFSERTPEFQARWLERLNAKAKARGYSPDMSIQIEPLNGAGDGYTFKGDEVTFKHKYLGRLAQACMSEFPGCCGLVIFHNALGDAWKPELFEFREEMCSGYFGEAVQTVVHYSMDGLAGWVLTGSAFQNPNTHNYIKTWTKILGDKFIGLPPKVATPIPGDPHA